MGLCVPKKLTLPILFLIGGIAIMLTAIFAQALGLDRAAGWGRGRVAILLIGMLVVVSAAVVWRAGKATRVLLDRAESFLAATDWGFQLLAALRSYWVAVPLCLFVVLVYVWLVSSGTWTAWTSPTRYYADLARGFQQGHLYLPIKVNPALLTSPDPYAPLPSGATQAPIDYTYYKGRYYLPWGAVPALIVWAWRGIFHVWLGDLQLTFGFISGLLVAQALIVLLLWQTPFRMLPKWLLWLAVPVIGLAGPAPFMLNNYLGARIYEASVAGGQFFLIAGLLMALIALEHYSREWALGVASACWALAIGTRPDLILPIAVLVLMISYWLLRSGGLSPKAARGLALLYLPLAMGGGLIARYNWARFGSVTETGYYYQLTGANLHKHWAEQFSAAYHRPNLYAYFINPLQRALSFPYVIAASAPGPRASQPVFYFSQIITGVLWLAPFTAFALAPLTAIRDRATVQDTTTAADDAPFLGQLGLALFC